MIAKTKEVLKKLEFGIIELLVGALMLIGLAGYFGSIPADLDWIDHTVAFLMFSYFFYILNITSILFGKTVKVANFMLVISYFSFFFKDVISYTEANASKFIIIKFVDALYLFFYENLQLVTMVTFYIGVIGVLMVSAYLARKIEVTHPSFLYAIHKKSFKNNLTKFFSIFLATLAFYYLIYNPILEWLEFVIDDPIIAVGIVFYLMSIARHHHKFHEKHIIFKIGAMVWGWYKKFISLFHYKKTLPLAISGLLILHALADLGVFAYSLAFLKENFYLEFLKSKHVPFLSLFLEDAVNLPSFAAMPLLIDYLLNALSLIILLLIPITVWARMFLQKELHFSRIYLFFIYSSITAYILLPGYIIKPLSDASVKGAGTVIGGVDILSVSLLNNDSVLYGLFPSKTATVAAVALTSIILGLVAYALSSNLRIKKELYAISIIGGLTFYAAYVFYFFSSLLDFFVQAMFFIATPHFLIGLVLMVFLALSVIFYIGGYFMFLYEIVMEYHKRKWSEPIDEELVVAIRKIKAIEKKMIKPRKAQIVGEVLKYAMVGVVTIVVLAAGYKMIDVVRERACITEITKFEIDLRNIDKSLRFGAKELQSHDAPCKADKIYFFDLNKNINPKNFREIPIIEDTLKNQGSNNIFLVREGDVRRSFYAGNLEIAYPYHICFMPKFDKISFFVEGMGKAAKITAACNQPECTYMPIEINDDEAKKLIREAIEFGCRNCPLDSDRELEKIRLTRQNVEMFRKFSVCEGVTEVQIIIRPKTGSDVKDFRFYEFIPKSCIDDLNSYLAGNIEGDVDIKSDPLILWYFKDLGKEKKVSYKLNTELDDNCKQAIKGLGVAQFVEGEEQEEEQQAEGPDTEPTIGGLPDVTLTGIGLKKNVIRNLWKYAQDRETSPKDLIYTVIDQTNNELVECSITNEKHVDCEVKQNKKGSSKVTIQIDDYKFTDRASFNIEVLPFCRKHEKKECVGNAIFWFDSCGKQEEFDKFCKEDETCKGGECQRVAQAAGGTTNAAQEERSGECRPWSAECDFGYYCDSESRRCRSIFG